MSAPLGLTALAALALAAVVSASSAARPAVSVKSTITTKDVAQSALMPKSRVSESYGTITNAQPQRGISADVPELSAWAIAANYPLVSESVSVASDGTFAYGAGGFSGAETNSFNRYDPVANTWTPLLNVPTAFYDAPSVYDPTTNSIYVFGGLLASGAVLTTTQIYNITNGTWTTGAPMPDPNGRYFASAAYYNGKIYVIGGFDGATFSEQSQTWEYDPVADTWNTSRAPIPVPMGGAGYSIVGQNVYLAGHWNGGLGSTDHYRYDIVANTWSAMAPVPVAIYRPDAAAIGTNTYLVGGGNPFLGAGSKGRNGSKLAPHPSMRAPAVSYNSTYIYDTVGNSWSTGPNTNVPHSFTGGTAIGNSLLVVTGYDGSTGDTNTVEKATLGGAPVPTSAVSRKVHGAAGPFDINLPLVPIGGALGIEDRQQGVGGGNTCGGWQVRTPFPPPTAYGSSATSDGTNAYVAGGYSFDTSSAINVFQRYNPGTDTWTVLAPMPDAEAETSAVYSPINNKVYVFGGDDPTTGIVSGATRIYDIGTNTWSAGMNMPDVRAFMASGYYNGKIYLIAGYNTGNISPAFTQVWEYDPVNDTFNTSRTPYPNTGFGGSGFGIINGHFYVAGGRDSTNTVIALVYDYNIATDTWTQRASLPAPNNVPGSGVVNGQLVVFGGGNPFAFAPDTTGTSVIYDPGSDTWTAGPTLNQQRSFPAGTAVGSTLVAAGGYTGSGTTSSTETTGCGAGAFGDQMVVTFASPVTVQSVSVTSGIGSVANFSVTGNVVTVNLTGVTNAQRLGVTLQGVSDGTNMGDVLIPMGVLTGDTDASATVDAADVGQTKAQSGNTTTAANFREDVNVLGSINAADVALVKNKSGTTLPP